MYNIWNQVIYFLNKYLSRTVYVNKYTYEVANNPAFLERPLTFGRRLAISRILGMQAAWNNLWLPVSRLYLFPSPHHHFCLFKAVVHFIRYTGTQLSMNPTPAKPSKVLAKLVLDSLNFTSVTRRAVYELFIW